MLKSSITCVLVLACATAGVVRGEDAAADPQQAEAQQAYEKLAEAYLTSDWDYVRDNARQIRRHTRFLSPPQRQLTAYMEQTYAGFRPSWWNATHAVSSTKFTAETWGKKFVTQYEPGTHLGFQGIRPVGEYVQLRDGTIVPRITGIEVLVSWQPGLVGDPKPNTGKLAERMGYTRGDMGEVIVWHELGHNYLTLALTLDQLVEVLTEHQLLFSHLQEFYADLTALHHTSPRTMRGVLQMRLDALDNYDDDEPHTRAAHAIGAMVVHEMLLHPDDWPSVHFPPNVPKQQAELNTIMYVYEHWEKEWSVDEAKRLRELVGDFIRQKGDATFRRKGTVDLPSRTQFKLMIAEDHAEQAKRDKWVAEQLQKQVDAGRADKLPDGETYEPRYRRERTDKEKEAAKDEDLPRIDIPW